MKISKQHLKQIIKEELYILQESIAQQNVVEEGIKQWLAGAITAAALMAPVKAKAETYNVEIKDAITGEVIKSSKESLNPEKIKDFSKSLNDKIISLGKNYNIKITPSPETLQTPIKSTEKGVKYVEISASNELRARSEGSKILGKRMDQVRVVSDPTGKTWKVFEIK